MSLYMTLRLYRLILSYCRPTLILHLAVNLHRRESEVHHGKVKSDHRGRKGRQEPFIPGVDRGASAVAEACRTVRHLTHLPAQGRGRRDVTPGVHQGADQVG